MKFSRLKLVIFLGIFSLISDNIYSQFTALDSCKLNFIIAWKKIEALNWTVSVLQRDNKTLQYKDSASQMQVKASTIANQKAEAQLDQFKIREAHTKPAPMFKWDGFYINFLAAYVFDPAFISTQVVKVLKYAISGEFIFKMIDRFKLTLEPMLPINDKFRIQGKIGYRLF